jgi:DNA polymerase-3 subunit beta
VVGAKKERRNIMEVRVAELREILKLLTPIVPKNPNLSVLKHVLLKDGQVTGTDLETMVRFDLKDAEGESLLPHKKALDLLNYVPGNLWVTIEQNGETVKLDWGEGTAEFKVESPDDYPDVRDIKVVSEGSISDGDSMVKVLREMLTYRATEDNRPVLNGVNVAFGETLAIAAADGFRLACQTLPIAYPAESSVNIPAGSVSILCTLWDKVPPPITPANTLVKTIISKRSLDISLSPERLIAHFGKVTILSNLIEGSFPNYAQLIPQEPPLKVTFLAPELERCVRRVRGIAATGSGAIRLSWNENKMTVSAMGEDISASSEMGVASNEPGGRIAVDVKYLLDYLSKKEGVVTLSITNESSPLLLRYGRAPVVVIMPMKVDWGDKPAADESEPAPEKPADEAEDSIEDEPEEPSEEPEDFEEPNENEEPPEEKSKKRTRRRKEKVS